MQVQFDLESEQELIRLAAFLAGGRKQLCHKVGVSTQAFWQWIDSGKVPHARVGALCSATGNRLQPYQVRPDVFSQKIKK